MSSDVLKAELETYGRELHNLLAHAGKYVLVHGDTVVNVFDSYEDALKTAYDKFGTKPFLVKQVQATEEVQHFSRDLGIPCRT